MQGDLYPGSPGADHRRPARSYMSTVSRELADDIKLFQELARSSEQDIAYKYRHFDKPEPAPATEGRDQRPEPPKKRAPRFNKLLKQAEQAAQQKPLTRKRYLQLMKEQVSLLPYMFNHMGSSKRKKFY